MHLYQTHASLLNHQVCNWLENGYLKTRNYHFTLIEADFGKIFNVLMCDSFITSDKISYLTKTTIFKTNIGLNFDFIIKSNFN